MLSLSDVPSQAGRPPSAAGSRLAQKLIVIVSPGATRSILVLSHVNTLPKTLGVQFNAECVTFDGVPVADLRVDDEA